MRDFRVRLGLFRVAWHCHAWDPPDGIRTTVSLMHGGACAVVNLDACCTHGIAYLKPWFTGREVRAALHSAAMNVMASNEVEHYRQQGRLSELGVCTFGRG